MTTATMQTLPTTLPDDEFADRRAEFHRAVYASEPFDFDQVMTRFWRPPEAHVAHDHSLLHAQGRWHVFVLSKPLSLHEKLVDAVRSGDWHAAGQFPYAVGDVHLAGPRLTELARVGAVLDDPLGEWGTLANTNSFVFPVGSRWANIHVAMGPRGQRLGIQWSDDLIHWRRDAEAIIWAPPAWAGGTDVCKGPCVVEHDGRYFIYYTLNLADGTTSVSLVSTADFATFEDHGPVLRFPHQYRGTQGCESPTAFVRNGMWHVMVACGDSWWHAISNRPDGFLGCQGIQSATVGGVYDVGPFHVAKVFQHQGQWWMTSSYKAEHRRRCRQEGRQIFRGENEDEAGLCAGLFITQLSWDGDRPILRKPSFDQIP